MINIHQKLQKNKNIKMDMKILEELFNQYRYDEMFIERKLQEEIMVPI